MSRKLKITVSIENENGESIIEKISEKEIPYLEEFDKQDFRTSFNQLERAILDGRKEVSDDAIKEYLEEISKKKIIQENDKTPESIISESHHLYCIESEVGSVKVVTHTLTDGTGRILYSIANDYFEKKNPMQRFESTCMEELSLQLASVLSYRPEANLLNRIRQQSEGVKTTTLRNTIENQGKAINKELHKKAEEILLASGFTSNGDKVDGTEVAEIKPKTMDENKVQEAATELKLRNEVKVSDYEEEEQTVNISADDVIVDRQATKRPNSKEKGKRKYASNTVIHVEKDKDAYIINEGNIKSALKLLMGFLLTNCLIGQYQYVFFTDGATDINEPIKAMFGFVSYKIILDWYHLVKKVKERLSMGMNGYKLRNAFLDLILPILWKGDVAGAIALLENLSDGQVKSREEIIKLIDYLKRNEEYIPCYIMRSKLGLRNSSNCVENANSRVVSYRQKARGMSWSKEGSTGLATVSAATLNGELVNWTQNRTLKFSFNCDDEIAA